MFKRFKPAFWFYNFFKRSELKHNIPLYKKYGIKKSYFDSISSEDFKDLPSELNKYDRLDSNLHMEEDEMLGKIDQRFHSSLKKWSQDGYVILDKFFSEKKVNLINEEIDRLITNKDVKFRYNGKKIMFSFHLSDLIRSVGNQTELMNILELLMGKK